MDYNTTKQAPGLTWWALPELVQEQVKKTVPTKDTWTLDVYKEGPTWNFSLPQFLTFKEQLCCGTELVLDYWYTQLTGVLAGQGSYLKLVVSSQQLEDYTTKCLYLYPDTLQPESSVYVDVKADMDVWLCPYLQVLFKGVPETLWLNLSTTDKY